MILRAILVACLLCSVAPAAADEPLGREALKSALDAAIDSHPTSRRTTVTLKVVDLESGDVLYDRGGDRLLTPASNLKIYTAACALDLFGPSHRFKTTLRAEGEIRGGVLHGDLELVGGGDSMFTHEDLAGLVDRAVGEWGLKRVNGRVTVDNSRYAPRLKGPGWMWDDDPTDYNMSVTPLMVDFNVLTVRLANGRTGLRANLLPPADSPPIREVEGDGVADGAAKVTREPFTEELLLHAGKVKDREQRLTMHDPGPWAASMLRRMLIDRGVTIDSPSGDQRERAKGDGRELTHEGKTLAETLKHFHEKSENAVGEVLLHEIAIAKGVERPDWPDGAKVLSEWLVEEARLMEGSFRLVDGSGLSRYNLISADSAVRLLKHMHGHEHFEVFLASLPAEKVDGRTAVWAKGGSMTAVSTISGYLETDEGRLLAFSLLANGFIGDNKPVFDLRQKVWRELVRFRE